MVSIVKIESINENSNCLLYQGTPDQQRPTVIDTQDDYFNSFSCLAFIADKLITT